jgi:hypothetical protein
MAKKWQNYCVQLDGVLKVGLGRLMGDQLAFNTDKINPYLAKAGKDGWELVSVVSSIGGQGTTDKLLLFFKREIQDA